MAAGLLAVGYVVARRARSGDLGRSTDGLREKAGEALPGNGSKIPIGDTGEDTSDETDHRTLGIGATEGDADASTAGSGESDTEGSRESDTERTGESDTGSGRSESGESSGDEDAESAVREAEDREDQEGEGHA